MPRLGRIALELSTQLGNVGIDGARHDESAISPHFLEKLGSSGNGAITPYECKQKLVRLWSERAWLTLEEHRSRSEVDVDVTERHTRCRRLSGSSSIATQERGNAFDQLDDAERLGYVLIRIELESSDLVGLFAPRRKIITGTFVSSCLTCLRT